ncbi:capsular biosynthesis protein [Natronospirillum operosum]|uniref:Capsular biosynthesis protein n=1 Tax=Natronospirillum operosum TaxID=2759953 RepID=A0A4Z0WLD4_9GAMM|nr:stealth family protein [Natronospirillum operosum]TGG96055.1 capsular biosynthesis protein [Natronospirillum operosum]
MSAYEVVEPPIDAVVTWVDGDDPQHRAKLNEYLASVGCSPRSASSTRFAHVGELDYCVASLLRFAPWLRRIHIVTDQQTPELVSRVASKYNGTEVVVVDHTAIFRGYENHLPTFNSIAIETMLWRIPGLTEQFIYLNDDFMLLKPLQPGDFFQEGRSVLRGWWNWSPQKRWDKRLRSWFKGSAERASGRPKNREAQARGAEIAGYRKKYLRVPHNPHALLRSTLDQFSAERPDLVEHNIQYRLRSSEQFLMDAVGRHLDLGAGRAVVDNRLRTLRLKPEDHTLRSLTGFLEKAERSPEVAFACVQSLDQVDEPIRREVLSWLDRVIGSPFE